MATPRMMTQAEADGLEEIYKATVSWETWCGWIEHGHPWGHLYDYRNTHYYRGVDIIRKAGAAGAGSGGPPPPAPVPTQPNLLRGKGLFTAWRANAANHRDADWIAVQGDPEGRHDEFDPGPARVLIWEARSLRGQEAVDNFPGAVGYIGQAENPDEFEMCMKIGPTIHVPKYIVGKPNGWGWTAAKVNEAMARAKAQGWGLLCEWYWNDNRNSVPDSSGYPVDAWLYGCFDGKDERKYLDQYQAVLGNANYGCYTAETMSARDWAAFS